MSSTLEPKFLLNRLLASTWSSADFAAFLKSKPAFLSEVLNVFSTLDQSIKLRVLLAFRALDKADAAKLPKDLLLAILDQAAGDGDEWVNVCASLVREVLVDATANVTGSNSRLPTAEVIADVLKKSGLVTAPPGEEESPVEKPAEATGTVEPKVADSSPKAARQVTPEPYFCPKEYLYLSEALIQRCHRSAPLTRKQNAHFVLGDLREVEMEPVPDTGLMPSPAPFSLPPSFATNSSSSSSLPHEQPPPPPPARAPPARPPPSGPRPAKLTVPAGARTSVPTSSLLSRAALSQQRRTDKPRLKLLKLDEVKSGAKPARTAARNEAVSHEFGSQPLRPQAPKDRREKPPRPSVVDDQPGGAGAGIEGGGGSGKPGPIPPPFPPSAPSSTRTLATQSTGRAGPLSAPPTAAVDPPPSLPSAVGPPDAFSDYYRMKARSNCLTPEDDEVIRNFYLHGATLGHQGEGMPRQKKIKINEEEQEKEDGSRVKETLYLTLNMDSKKAVLSRKVSRAKESGAAGALGGGGR